MSEPTTAALIEAARAYEALFVPALFAQFAPMVAEAARIAPGQRVLDVACGTGVLAREAAVRAGSPALVAGIDANPGMLAVARQLAPAVEWHDGVAESLPFADGSFQAVVSQFGLMFFRDRRQALREMRRVLSPGGRLAVAVWNTVDSMPAFAAEVAVLERTAGRPAANALRAPFVLGRRADLEALCADAGLAAAHITTRRGTARFPGIRPLVEADLRGWLPVMGVFLADDLINRVLQDAEGALAAYATSDGRAEFEVSAHVITASNA